MHIVTCTRTQIVLTPRLCLEMERQKRETERGCKEARGRNLLDGRPVLGSVHFNGPLQRFLLCRIPSLPHALFATRRRSISCPTATNNSAQGNRNYRFLICETSLASTARKQIGVREGAQLAVHPSNCYNIERERAKT